VESIPLEDHRLFHRLNAGARRLGQDALDLCKHTLNGGRGLCKTVLSCQQQAQRQRKRFVLCKDQRGKFVAWSQAIGSIAASFSLYRDAEIGKGLDVITNRSDIHLKPPGKLCAGQASM